MPALRLTPPVGRLTRNPDHFLPGPHIYSTELTILQFNLQRRLPLFLLYQAPVETAHVPLLAAEPVQFL